MKSLLVDVLRQAQGDAPTEDQPSARRQAPHARHEDVAPAPDELNLLETGQYEAPLDDPALTESPVADLEADVVADAPVPAEPPPPASLAETAVLSARGARLSEQPSLVTRIAHWSPIICVLAVACVASGYLLFNQLAGGSLNDDLDEISDIVNERRRGNWLEASVADTDVFDRAPVRPREPVVGDGAAGLPESVDPEPSTARPRAERRPSAPANTIMVSATPAASSDVSDPVYQHVADAYDAYRAGRYLDAERHYRAALHTEPNHHGALLGLAGVYQQTGRRSDAVRAYERVLEIEPGDIVAASALLSLRSSEPGWDSESELKLLIQRFPDADHLHFSLGSVFVGERRWAEARRAFAAARALRPQNPVYNYNLAVSCERLGDIRCARAHYQTALNNADGFARLDRAVVEQHLDRLSAALGDPR